MNHLPQEIIRRKRDGQVLSADEVRWFISAMAQGEVSDAQVAAFAMAVYFKGMTMDERIALTLAMRDSGEVMDWRGLGLHGPVLDKHSTGGVGDTVSLMLGPMLGACGAHVPMISGRGLGHTGGTLDKLESIPGYQTTPPNELFRNTVRQVGVAIIGQTGHLAPADQRIYAIRDVTATVESIDLITASILSKKLAAGLEALVMDVKVGCGAFMPSLEASRNLAQSIVDVASGAGTRTTALLTDMNQCLADSAGNALEVKEAVAFLTGKSRSPRLQEVTLALGAEALCSGGLAKTPEEARSRLENTLRSGQAAEVFGRMVAALGGPIDFLEKHQTCLPMAPVQCEVHARTQGCVARIALRELGLCVVRLGGGRTRADQVIDPAVGLTQVLRPGEMASTDRPLAVVHARTREDADRAADQIRDAFQIGSETPESHPVILQRVIAKS